MTALWLTAVSYAEPAEPDANVFLYGTTFGGDIASVGAGGIFTQRVRFERTDATGNLQFGISVPITEGMRFAGRPVIDKSGSGQTTNVNITDYSFNWRGGIAENGFIEILIPVRVNNSCSPTSPDTTCSVDLTARVFNDSGEEMMSETVEVVITPSDFSPSSLEIGAGVVMTNGDLSQNALCGAECEQTVIKMTNTDSQSVYVKVGAEKIAGLKYLNTSTGIFSDMDFNDGRAPEMQDRFQVHDVEMEPGETVEVPLNFAITKEFADDTTLPLKLFACVSRESNQRCTQASVIFLDAINFQVRRRDLGDAPDSTNHFASPMPAYPGVMGNFPTTADPALPGPQGPAHDRPWPLHLGRQVSFEAEADIGPDSDGPNNLEPGLAVPLADLDGGEDGVRLETLSVEACKTTEIDLQVAILPGMVTYYQQNGGMAYLNVWLDGNHDGDWADAMMCDDADSPEHIVIDEPIDVVTLGVGLHNLKIKTTAVPWMDNPEVDNAAWMRVTLAEQMSPKLPGLSYGDGRGPAGRYRFGETEDYLYYPSDSEGHQPQIEITLEEVDRGDERREPLAGDGRAPEMLRQPTRELIVRFYNKGFKPATDLQIEVKLGDPLDQILYDSWSGCLTCVRSAEVYQAQNTVLRGPDAEEMVFSRIRTFNIGTLQPQSFGTIVLGWSGCLTCTRAPEMPSVHTVRAFTPELEWTKSLERSSDRLMTPFIRAAWTGCLTCTRSADAFSLWDYGGMSVVGTPGSTIKMLLNGEPTGQTAVIGPDGYSEINLDFPPENVVFGHGPHAVRAFQVVAEQGGKQSRPSNVLDMSCPVSGIHIVGIGHINAEGEVDFVPHLKPTSNNPAIRVLAGDKSQDVSLPGFGNFLAYRNCRQQEVTDIEMFFRGEDVTFDKEMNLGNGTTVLGWTGCLTCTRAAEDDEVGFTVKINQAGFSEPIEYGYVLEYGTPGHFMVKDASTGKALEDVEITVLRKVKKGTGRHTWVDVGHCVTTLKDGSWSALVPEGEYMVIAKKDGYQPYRSGPILADSPDDVFIVLTSGLDELFDSQAPRYDLGFDINMTPRYVGETEKQIDITAGNPAIQVTLGDVVRFVNWDRDMSLTAQIDGRVPQSTSFDSGLLAAGESYTFVFDQPGTYTYQMDGDENREGVIVVTGSSSMSNTIYLPIIVR